VKKKSSGTLGDSAPSPTLGTKRKSSSALLSGTGGGNGEIKSSKRGYANRMKKEAHGYLTNNPI